MAANIILDEVIRNADLRAAFKNRTHGYAGVMEGTNANTIKTSYAVSYEINGQLYYKAATDNIAMTACAAQADANTAYYLLTIGTTGTVTTTKGTATALPAAPANEALLAVMKIVTSGGTFTSGTTDLSGTGVTDTYAHIEFYPQNGDVSALTFA